MADDADSDEVHWVCPQRRGQLSITQMHIPRRLKKNLRAMKIGGAPYTIKINSDFKAVIMACAEQTQNRDKTWINPEIIDAYCTLHEDGFAHSIECWQDGLLIGGLYGVSIGGIFCGESMFSRRRDASKLALAHLAARLYHAKYAILDTQFTNDHLEQFGVYEIQHEDYMKALKPALLKRCHFDCDDISELALIQNYLKMQAAS